VLFDYCLEADLRITPSEEREGVRANEKAAAVAASRRGHWSLRGTGPLLARMKQGLVKPRTLLLCAGRPKPETQPWSGPLRRGAPLGRPRSWGILLPLRRVSMVLDLPPYPWDCFALQFRCTIVLRLGAQRSSPFALRKAGLKIP